MKKVLGMAVAALMLASVVAKAEVAEVSKRMDGLNPGLIGITADEYSDFMSVNTANILDVDGIRLYTQLSNLGDGQDDTALANSASDNELLIGGVKPMFDMGNFGGFLWRNKEVDEIPITYANMSAADAGAANIDPNTASAETGEYDYEDIDDSADRITETETGEAYSNKGDISIDLLAGLDTLIALGDLGIRVGYQKDTAGDFSKDFEYSYDVENDPDDYYTQEYSNEGNEYTSVISIAPSIRGLSLMDIDLGATLDLSMVKKVDNSEINADMTQGATYTGGFAGAIPGVLVDDYARTYSREDTKELTGMMMGLKVDGSYALSDTVNIKGLAGLSTGKLTGERENSWTDEVTEHSEGAIDEKVTFEQAWDEEEKRTDIQLLAGIDKQVSDSLLMGIGLGYSREAEEVMSDEGRSVTDTDGNKTYSTSIAKTTDKTVDSTVSLPIGLEWTANSWLKARLGASYVVIYEKDETETVTTTYEDGTSGAKVVGEETETVTNTTVPPAPPLTPASDEVAFYSGVGFMVTENLTVDVTNVGTSTTVLDPSTWQLSATLKF